MTSKPTHPQDDKPEPSLPDNSSGQPSKPVGKTRGPVDFPPGHPGNSPQEDSSQPANEAGQPVPGSAGGQPKGTPQSMQAPGPAAATLKAKGVTNEEHLDAARALTARGVPLRKIVGWIDEYGPGVVKVIKEILDAIGHDKGNPPTMPPAE